DVALANGASPERDVPTALHARRLTGLRERRRLAAAVTDACLLASRPYSLSPSVLDLPAVATAHTELVILRDRLLAPGPVSVRGVAAVRCLLTNGAGPLYGARPVHAVSPGRSLGGAVRHVAELLTPVP